MAATLMMGAFAKHSAAASRGRSTEPGGGIAAMLTPLLDRIATARSWTMSRR